VPIKQKQAALVQSLRDNYPVAEPEPFGTTVTLAEWVDAHLPKHDTGELASSGLRGGAKAFYSWGSSLVHGYKWASEYAPGVKLFGMIADSLAAAIYMTESAVALFEAACRAPDGERTTSESYVPARLEPTIAARSPRRHQRSFRRHGQREHDGGDSSHYEQHEG
jgi:hypothetical protein